MARKSTPAADGEIDIDELPATVWAVSGGQRVFHTSEDCRYAPENPRKWDRETAIAWGRRLCSHCLRSGPLGPGRGEGHYQTLREIGKARDDRERPNPWPQPAPADD